MTALEKIKKMRVTAKLYDIDAAAGILGVKPWTVRKWFRTYDIHGYKGKTPDLLAYTDLLWIAEHLREVDAGGRKFTALTNVQRVVNKNGQKIIRVPELGFWTPKPTEIKNYLRRLHKEVKEDAERLINEGYLPVPLIAPRLGVSQDVVRSRAVKMGVKTHAVLANRFPFYNPPDVDAAVKAPLGMRKAQPSGRARVKPDDRQLPLFDLGGKQAGVVKAAVIHRASALDAPVTPKEIKKSLVKALNKDAVEILVKAGKYMTAQVSAARLGVHPTTIRSWFAEDPKRKQSIMCFGRILLYPVSLLKMYEEQLNTKVQEKARKLEEIKVKRMDGSIYELAKVLSKSIRGCEVSEGERKLLVEFGRLVMLDMAASPWSNR